MADNPIVNSNQNSSNFDVKSVLETVVAAMTTFSDNIKEIKEILNKNSTNKNDAESRRVNAELANHQRESAKALKELLSGFSSLQKAQKEGNKDAERINNLLGKSIENLSDIYKKGTSVTAELKKSQTNLVELNKKLFKAEEGSAEYNALQAEINNLNSQINDYIDEYTELAKDEQNENNKRTGQILKKFTEALKSSDSMEDAYKAIEKDLSDLEKQQDKENKRKAKQEKIDKAKEYKIWDDIKESFEDGLFALPNKLNNAFDKGIQNNLNAISGSLMGQIIGFAEKSLFTMMDYQTTKTVEAIGSLQSTFESTGQNLARAIMTDTDEIKESWVEISDRLQREGYDKALSVLDIAQLEEIAARAGITNLDELSTIGYTAGVLKSKTGVEAADFLSSENLMYLHNIYREVMSSGKSEEENKKDFEYVMTEFAKQITGAVGAEDTAIAFAEGKSQELLTKYLKDVSYYGDINKALTISASRVAGQAAFGNVGALSIYEQMITGLENLKQTGITSGEGSDIFNILSGVGTLEEFKEEDYGEFLKKSLKYLFDVDDITNSSGATYLLKNIFGVNPEDFEMLKNMSGGYEGFISRLDNIEKGVNSYEAILNNTLLAQEGGTTTTKDQLENQALNDVINIWSNWADIPNGAVMLQEGIKTATKGVEYAISSLGKLLLGSNFSGSMLNAFTGSLTGSGVTGSLAGISGVLGFGAVAIPVAMGISKLIDIATEQIDVIPTEESVENLAKIQKANEEINKQKQEEIIDVLNKSFDIQSALKDDTSKLAKDVTDINDTKQNYGSIIKSKLSDQSLTFKSNNDLTDEQRSRLVAGGVDQLKQMSDTELASYVYANEDLFDFSHMGSGQSEYDQARVSYVDARNTLASDTLNKSIKSYLSDKIISAEESASLSKDVTNIASTLDDKDAANQLLNNYAIFEQRRKVYNAALALKSLLEAETNLSNASEKYGTNDKDTIYKTAKAQLLGGKAFDWVYNRNPVLAMQYNGLWDNALSLMDVNKSMDANALALGNDTRWAEVYGASNISKFATGINYVPYDNYPALLHKGERVQTYAEARLEDIVDATEYLKHNSGNFKNNINNNEELTTTNNSINDGFNTTADNQMIIIQLLKSILQSLNMSPNNIFNESQFDSISEDKTALRGNNMIRIASTH